MENKYYLKFVSLGHTDWIQIFEPVGIDGASISMKQNTNRHSRDIFFIDVDKLTFVDATSGIADNEQVVDIYGNVSRNLSHGLSFHLETIKLYGFESVVLFDIRQNDVSIRQFQLSYIDDDLTDGYSYVNCKVVDNNNIAEVKRQIDTKFNSFSDKDVNGNTITPINSINYLKRATPETNVSKWKLPNNVIYNAGARRYVNFSQSLTDANIKNSLSWLDPTPVAPNISAVINNIRLVKAKNDLSNLSVKITSNVNINYRVTSPNANSKMFMRLFAIVTPEPHTGFSFGTEVYYKEVVGNTNQVVPIDETIAFTTPNIPRDYFLSIYWELGWDTTNLASGNRGSFDFYKQDIEITATETAIDTVIKVVRWNDLIKQSIKWIKPITTETIDFDANGTHYNNFCFNRSMISNKTDNLTTTPKKILESVEELNYDYEINEDNVKILNYENFYDKLTEIAVFQQIPSSEYTQGFNDKLKLNNFKYSYNKFAQDRDILNSDISIHTNTEWIIPNKQVENKKEVKIDFIRDGKFIQDIVNVEISKPTTATNDDDDIMIEQGITLAPNSFGSFGKRLTMRVVGGNLEILNNNSSGDDILFNWTNLGINPSATFQITQGENSGSYNVLEITDTILRLTPISFTPTFNGDAYITIKYFYFNVQYQTRFSEGFTIPTQKVLPNIFYSIKRNFKYFSSFFASVMLFQKTLLKNTYFKSNGEFRSRLIGESVDLIEKADYLYADFDAPIISEKVHKINVYATFENVRDFLNEYKDVKGFVRCLNSLGFVIKGFVKDLKYNITTNELELNIEELYEPLELVLTFADGVLTVNDVPYNLSGVSKWWKFENDYVKFFDKNNIAICNDYKYNFVILNGIRYNSRLELETALING